MIAGGMLVAAPERWDEACFAVPAVRALMAAGMAVGVVCPADQRGFWESLNGLAVMDFLLNSKPKVVAAGVSGTWEASLAWDTGVAAEVFKIAGISRRLGIAERKLSKLLTHPLEVRVGPLEHRVRHYLAAVELLGIDTERAEFFMPADLGIHRIDGSVLLCPGSDFGPSHEWEIERWVELGLKLLDTGKSVSVAVEGGGRGLGQMLAARLGDGVEILSWSLGGDAWPLLANYAVVIAADGSLPHLAAHAGATCVTLFGPNDPAWKRPLGRRHAVVRRHVECAPCLLAKCPLDRRCQVELETERVWRAVADKLG
ncbi:MAG: hypothetical protein ORN51_03940 [Akkermansiaceae bacterium]|jgi:ADP-heptose:LPS heptosyltransferase|nr:hypothetical protein [Akkermansiaceae bacterium]